jgi:hypothetical protein
MIASYTRDGFEGWHNIQICNGAIPAILLTGGGTRTVWYSVSMKVVRLGSYSIYSWVG